MNTVHVFIQFLLTTTFMSTGPLISPSYTKLSISISLGLGTHCASSPHGQELNFNGQFWY